MSNTVDQHIYDIAEGFVSDMEINELIPLPTNLPARNALILRVAKAMQQAIEDECEAIRQELQNG